jgi:DHA2 family multidrug resistance protein
MFYLNIPIGLFSLSMILIFLREKEEKKMTTSMDWGGIGLLFITVTTLQSALNRWNIDNWFRSPFIITLFVIAILSLSFFIVWESFHSNPFIKFSYFKIRSFLLPALTTGIGMGIIFSSFVLDALWVQQTLGYTPAWAGLSLAPVGLLSFIMYPLIGRYISLLDLRIWICISFMLYAVTFFLLSRINLETPYSHLAWPRLIQGLGFALFTIPNSIYIMKGVEEQKFTEVISLFSFTRMLFVGFGVALSITLWFVRQAYYQTLVMAKTYQDSHLFHDLLATFAKKITVTPLQSVGIVNDVLTNQSSTLALADLYYLFAFIFILMACSLVFYETP